jgi:primosomal protein N' (replication factor Y)
LNYYELSFLNSPLKPLTYQSASKLKLGILVEVKLSRRKILSKAVVVKKVDKPTFKCLDIIKINDSYYDNIMLQTAKFISSYYVCSIGEALSLYTAFDSLNIKELKEIKLLQNNIKLSKKQQELLNFTQKNKTSLLFANTGSGKTEIYIKAIENILNQNKQVVLLMPEISLTPQMQQRLEKVFGFLVAIWHSKITKSKKQKILQGLKDGNIRLIAGARSALFLPFVSLGLIVVDEEHDLSYKATNKKPRINAKDIALFTGAKFGLNVILGSATPSLNSYKKLPYIINNETYFDTSKTISFDDSNLQINEIILEKINNTLKKDEQVIVFLPTRANFKYQICSDCGESLKCPFCSVSLSLHKNFKFLKCHYCNFTQAINETCPECKTGVIKNFRLGTVEAQQILQEYFKDKIVDIFDTDSVKTNKNLKKILKNFNDKKIDILVGTQMLSKGHDYHNVTLAIILGIDSVLSMTSYQAREKALSLALQIAGRSGRKGVGEVFIQTKNISFFQKYMQKENYEAFLQDELKLRKELYPPFVKLAKITFSHKNATLAKKQLDIYVGKFLKFANIVQVVGFGESAVFKISNFYRYELLLRSKDTKALLGVLHLVDCSFASIDMDTVF